MDKQNQANKDFQQSLRQDDIEDRDIDQTAFKADRRELGVDRDQDRDALNRQQGLNEDKQRNMDIGKDVQQDRLERKEVGRDQEWSQRREQQFDQDQEKIQQDRPELADLGIQRNECGQKECDRDQKECDRDQKQDKRFRQDQEREVNDRQFGQNMNAEFQAQNLGLRR